MSSKIDRLHKQALESVEAEWGAITRLAISEAKTALSVDGRRAVGRATHQLRNGEEVEECPERFREWWGAFTDHFRRAREDLILPREVPDPPDERGEWSEAVGAAQTGNGVPIVVLAFARAVRQKRS